VTFLTTRHALSTVESAYCLSGTDGQWLERVLAAAAPDLDRGMGLYGATGKIHLGSLYPEPPFVRVGLSDECMQHALALHPRLPCPVLDAFAPRAVVVGGLDEAWPKKIEAAGLYRVGMQGAGVRDALVAFARDGEAGAVKIVAPSRSPVTTHARTRAVWGRVMLHVAAALRLRRRVAAGAMPESVLDDRGRVVDGANEGSKRGSRIVRALREALRARESQRDDPERALGLWSALLAGRYSAVDRFESDGRRFVVVYRNEPISQDLHVSERLAEDPRALGASERRVVELVALGASVKEAAYALGISSDAARQALGIALRKLGLGGRSDLTAWFAGARTAVSVRMGQADLEALVTESHTRLELPSSLTQAEREVAESVVRGLANAEIARARGTSVRTVANQMRTLFEKLGVGSRGELRARLVRGGGTQPSGGSVLPSEP
jgi:DNA-binding CsgD family transcriptional regulator